MKKSTKLILAALAIGLLNTVSALALTYQSETDLQFTFNPTISISISGDLIIDDLAPGSSSDSNIITVTAESNAVAGYNLSSTVGSNINASNELRKDGTSTTYKFSNLTSNLASLSNFNDNDWGYSYSVDNGTTWRSNNITETALTGYGGYTYNSNTSTSSTITHISSTAPGTNSIQYKIGAKASNTQAAGAYTNTINFTAIANPNPLTVADITYMQDITSDIVTNTAEGITFTLKDKRDEQSYTVAKLKDGKLWMTENLNLAGGTALTADTTDVTTDYINNFTTSNNLTKDGNTIVLPASSTTGFDTDSSSYVANSGSTTCGDNSPCYSYYSWDAATLGSGRTISTAGTDASYSICPKNWKLPNTRDNVDDNTSDFHTLVISLNGSTTTATAVVDELTSSPNNFLLAGYYDRDSEFRDGGSYGRYWSSTSSGSYHDARFLYFSLDMISLARSGSRSLGRSIRCLAK